MLGEAARCVEGTVSLPPGPALAASLASLLPRGSCQPEEGICFSSLTSTQGGVQVASFGCWPPQAQTEDSIAWYGVPECKNEVTSRKIKPSSSFLKSSFYTCLFQFNRLLCLCLSSLCNSFLPSMDDDDPELEDTQALIIIVVIILITVLIFCFSSCLLCKACNSGRVSERGGPLTSKELEAGYCRAARDTAVAPPLMRMCSAPASMMGPAPAIRPIVFRPNLHSVKLKESLKQLEILTLPSRKDQRPKKETEV